LELKKLEKWIPNIDPQLLQAFELYATELLRFNKAINLISPTTADKLAKVHFADCILGSQIVFKQLKGAEEIYDFGSGNGFPGLIMALLWPELKIVLIEKDQRKAEFLSHIADLLKISNATVLNKDIEDIQNGSVQFAVSRAFAPLSKALLITRHLFAKGGQYFHFKSDTWSIEMAHVPSQLFSTWKADHIGDYKLPESETLHAILKTTRL
jgi:16S rRNA (guanine527-N7)-methyltransferase